MKLSDWLGLERGRSAALATRLNIKPPQVAGWISGDKPVPVRHMAAIEVFTGAQVTRQEMRPDDWQDIWPELVSADAGESTHPPALANDAPCDPAGSAAGPGYTGPDRRKNPEAPCANPDLERREPIAARLAGQGG